MNTKGVWHLSAVAVLTGTVFLNNNTAHAQYTTSFQTNIISAVASNWVSNPGYVIGSNKVFDALLIQNGGALFNGFGYLGFAARATNNTAVISGSGSVWSNSFDLYVGRSGAHNSLVITNHGQVFDGYGCMGYNSSSSNNSALVTGSSVWRNSGDLCVGWKGGGNSVVISDQGQILNANGFVGYYSAKSSGNSVLVTGSGSVWSNSSDLYLGRSGARNSLAINNQAKVFNGYGYVGYNARSSNNSVSVTGGSVWNNKFDLYVGRSSQHNSMVISNQGKVFSGNGFVGCYNTSGSDSVLVMGSGSVWSNTGDLYVGWSSARNNLVITNQGQVFDDNGFVGYNAISGNAGSNNNSVLVTDPGSIWSSRDSLCVGYRGSSNTLTIANGASVIASNAFIGFYSLPAIGNRIDVSASTLYVTNKLANGALDIRGGTLLINSSTVTVDALLVTNGPSGQVIFNSGLLNTKATTVVNGLKFIAGNGTNAATLNLASGGTGFHSFADGLMIASNAMLMGNGTVMGTVTVNPGGKLSPGHSPGSMTFSNNLTLAPKSVFAVDIDGNAPEQYDHITVLGTVSVSNCVLSLDLGFTPAQGYWFTIISNYGPSAVLGTFVDPQGDVLTNNATFTADGLTLQIHYDLDSTGQDVVLTVIVPEPSTLLLVALGLAGLIGLRRRLGRGRVW
jgi:T5SS/PEP-CTERM-associated repeat protein